MIGNSLLLAAAASSTLLNGLVGYWKLDGDGSDVLGVSNGTVQGAGITWGAGKLGSAMLSNYLSLSRVNVGGAAQIKPTAAMTVGGWFWFNATGNTGRWCSDWHQDGSKDRWIFPYAPSNDLFLHIGYNAGPIGTVGGTLPINTWTHLAATIDATAVSIYRNAVQVWTSASGIGTLTRTGAGNVCIGSQEETGNAIDGKVDEFAMWNRALTAGEVSEWFNAGVGKTHPF